MVVQKFKITIALLLSLILSVQSGVANYELDDEHVEVALRMLGHQILLNDGDSTSRVLPIIKYEKKHVIQFEHDLSIDPEKLINSVNDVISKTQFAKSYFVKVESCESKDIVYSYEKRAINDDDIIPCKSRILPPACYNVVFIIIEPGEFVLIENEADDIQAGINKYVWLTLLILGTLGFLYLIKIRRRPKSNPDFIMIGEYQFDRKGMRLLYNNDYTELSSKEADLLHLLYESENETLEREHILKVIWGDEGDYVGRTLDVFISKLRKKLELDLSLKIINIRGIGYRFVMSD